MTMLMMRRTPFNALSRNERRLESGLFLGEPLIVTDGQNEWAVFDDWRFKLDDIALFAAARSPRPPKRAKDIDFPEDADPWQEILTAQKPPPGLMRMESVLPDGFTPVENPS